MQGYKASYILTKSEMLFLLSGIQESKLSKSASYIISEYLKDSVPSHDTVESLISKKLARKSAGKILIEPVMDMLIRSVLAANALWELRCAESGIVAVVIRTDSLYLNATQYRHITGAWKITPIQDRNKLDGELSEIQFDALTKITNDNIEELHIQDNNYSWLEED